MEHHAGSSEPWRHRAEKIISELAFAAWEKANRLPNGRIRKMHQPYTVPPFARALTAALGLPEPECEHECKRLFHLYATGAESLI